MAKRADRGKNVEEQEISVPGVGHRVGVEEWDRELHRDGNILGDADQPRFATGRADGRADRVRPSSPTGRADDESPIGGL